MTTVGSVTRGALSWQQAGRLRRDAERGERIPNVSTLVRLPAGMTPADLRRRLSEIVRREEVLRITDVPDGGDGYVSYSPAIEPPLRYEQADSAGQMTDITARLSRCPLARHGGPLWRATVIEHPDDSGQTMRTLCAAFDHLVTDGRSLQLFGDELTGADASRTGRQHGRYQDWVMWQRQRFPWNAAGERTAAREFWRRHLDGTPADRDTELPFCSSPAAPLSGTVYTMHHDPPISARLVRLAARKLRATPFLLMVAGVAAAAGMDTRMDDLTLRITTSGRPAEYLDTHGWFSDCVPMRLRHTSLHDPWHALRAARSSWLEIFEYQTTPWDYVRAVSALPGHPAARPVQIGINFIPYEAAAITVDDIADGTGAGDVAGLQMSIAPGRQAAYHLACQFDPARFMPPDVRAFLGLLDARLGQLVACAS